MKITVRLHVIRMGFFILHSFTPTPNRAKSPFSGSSGKTSFSLFVSLMADDMEAVLDCSSPRRHASCSTWVSIGMIRVRLSMTSFHIPRSTGDSSLTIQRRNMQRRLQLDCVFFGIMPSTFLVANYFVIFSKAS